MDSVVTTASTNQNQCFRLKGSLFTFTVLQLYSMDEIAFEQQLQNTISQAPQFFRQAPIIIDLHEFTSDQSALNLALVKTQCQKHGLIPIAIRGGKASTQEQARTLGLAILTNGPQPNAKPPSKTTTAVGNPQTRQPIEKIPQATTTSKIIQQPVRSGQQVYAKGGDLIILSSVSHGAEVLADGHIHVYGPLRGRALAGVKGDTSARIFCKTLEAELVSIAGYYLLSEQLSVYCDQTYLQLFLENEQLKCKVMS